MDLIEYAKAEFRALGWPGDCEVQKEICDGVLELLKVFFLQNYSFMTAPDSIDLFSKLVNWKPLSPLTGNDDEWMKREGGKYQNKRFAPVFKTGKSGKAYLTDAITWINQRGVAFTGEIESAEGKMYSSDQFITFPFVPKRFEIGVVEDEDGFFELKCRAKYEMALEFFKTPAPV